MAHTSGITLKDRTRRLKAHNSFQSPVINLKIVRAKASSVVRMHIPVNHKTQQTLPIKYNSKFSSCNRQIHQDNSICLSSNNNIMLPKRQIFFSLHMARNKCTIIILLIKEDPPAPQIKIIVMCDSAKDSRATLKSRSFKRILCRIILVRYSIQSAWKRTQKSFWPFSSQMT